MNNAAARLLCRFVLASLFLAVPVASANEPDKSKLLTRSVYVTVDLKLCEHLDNAVLYQGEQALGVLPVTRIFQFTYYPHLGRLEPVRTDVRVEGVRQNGEAFIGRLAVTPWGIFTANQEIELDLKKQLRRMRYKLDVRYKPRTVKLACSDACERRPDAVAARATASETETETKNR